MLLRRDGQPLLTARTLDLIGGTGITLSSVLRSNDEIAMTIMGSRAVATSIASSSLTAADSLVLCDATSAAFTLTLPAAPPSGTTLTLKRINVNANNVTVARGGASLIGGSGGVTSITLEYGVATPLVYDGANWQVID